MPQTARTTFGQNPPPATEQAKQIPGSAVQVRPMQDAVQALIIAARSVIGRLVLQHGAQCALQGIVV
jgi:hypothetical protein